MMRITDSDFGFYLFVIPLLVIVFLSTACAGIFVWCAINNDNIASQAEQVKGWEDTTMKKAQVVSNDQKLKKEVQVTIYETVRMEVLSMDSAGTASALNHELRLWRMAASHDRE